MRVVGELLPPSRSFFSMAGPGGKRGPPLLGVFAPVSPWVLALQDLLGLPVMKMSGRVFRSSFFGSGWVSP